MITPDDLDEPWRSLYPRVSHVARAYLSTISADGRLDTTTLGRAILKPWPGSANARKLFQALRTEARGSLADCCSPGPVKRLYGRDASSLVWHRPDPAKAALRPSTPATAHPQLAGGLLSPAGAYPTLAASQPASGLLSPASGHPSPTPAPAEPDAYPPGARRLGPSQLVALRDLLDAYSDAMPPELTGNAELMDIMQRAYDIVVEAVGLKEEELVT